MSFAAQYPPVLTETGDNTSQVLAKFNSEFQYLYVTLLSQLFSATTGHAHTGNGSDGAKITTTSLVDNAITTAKITDANVTTAKIADSNVTTAKVADGAITAAKLATDVLSAMYPVGSIYMNVLNTSPATLFGGTWAQIKDAFLLSCGDTYANGATGGEATHTLTEAETPRHQHADGQTLEYPQFGHNDTANTSGFINGYSQSSTEFQSLTSAFGGGQAHNNMPPYLAVYVWKRTA